MLQRESVQFQELLLTFAWADMILIFFFGGYARSLKTWVHKQLFFIITAEGQLKRMSTVNKNAVWVIHAFVTPILWLSAESLKLDLVCAYAFSLGIISWWQPSSSCPPPWYSASVSSQWSAAASETLDHTIITLHCKQSWRLHARAQEQPSGKVTNNVALTEKDKLAQSYSSVSANFKGWSQVTANLACMYQQEHVCSSAKL